MRQVTLQTTIGKASFTGWGALALYLRLEEVVGHSVVPSQYGVRLVQSRLDVSG